MNYPLPSYALTVWFDGENYHVCSPPAPGASKGTHCITKNLAEVGEIARALHGQQTKPEPRLRGTLANATSRVEFDLTGGVYTQLYKPKTEKALQEIAAKAIASGARIHRHDGHYVTLAERKRDEEAAARRAEQAKRAAKSQKVSTKITLADLGF